MAKLIAAVSIAAATMAAGTGVAVAGTQTPTKSKAPVVAGLRASPSRLAHTGGRVTLTARVARASMCELTVAGLDAHFACAGTVSKVFLFPADATHTPDRYTLTLTAIGKHGRTARRTHVMVAGVPAHRTPSPTPPRTSPPTAPPGSTRRALHRPALTTRLALRPR